MPGKKFVFMLLPGLLVNSFHCDYCDKRYHTKCIDPADFNPWLIWFYYFLLLLELTQLPNYAPRYYLDGVGLAREPEV